MFSKFTGILNRSMGIKRLKHGIRMDVYQFKVFGAEMLDVSYVLN